MARGISVHVGINELDKAHYQGWDGKLVACESDAEAMERMPEEFEGHANLLNGIQRGTITVPGSSDNVTVDLSLPTDATIRAQDISVTPLTSLGHASSWWVGVISADHFVIRTDVAPGGSGVDFAWSVDLGRY